MLAGEYLNRIRQLPIAGLSDLTRNFPFVVLSPHPDDETLGLGGLLHQACASSQQAHLIILTDGSGSHPKSRLYPRDRLTTLRQEEVRKAAAILGLSGDRIYYLNVEDTQAPKSGPLFDHTVAQVVDIVRRAEAKSLFVTWQHDPHCDHEAAALIARAVRDAVSGLKLWAYPIWGWHLDSFIEITEPPPTGIRLDISQQAIVKKEAISAYASQMTDLISDDPEGFRFTDSTLGPFLGSYEYFIEVP